MVTDGILGAVAEMVNQADDDYAAAIIQSVANMLADFDEDQWEAMGEDTRREWIGNYM